MAETRNPQEEFVIVPKRRKPRPYRVVGVLVLCLLSGLVGYGVGWSQGGYRIEDVVQTRPSLARELSAVKAEYDEVRQEKVRLERTRAIDAQALITARDSIADLESTIANLEADLTFYRNIMAPSEASKGLQVDQLSLRDVRGEGRYDFKLVLTQVGDNKSYISGLVAVNIIGEQEGEQEVIPLRDLSEDVEDLGVRFRFRYFQDVEGTLALPDNFEPYEVQVVAKAEGSKASQAERTFEWRQLAEN
ncbi:DUF6776 family protein [Marinobacter zhanjiangensis]|uniref:MSHA biogenesis protein MshJ n=1 Tax=Marinobacter zhanjiangensis TaxID=578215 RepID=A0ABQ3BBP3_9GAMM|nr:DUF6776 family protein [Marinobacter zhanjiangensis]GGY83277.1 hypothetical protein GCM10007071_33210 [Marinobacter zhanjiangensis]